MSNECIIEDGKIIKGPVILKLTTNLEDSTRILYMLTFLNK